MVKYNKYKNKMQYKLLIHLSKIVKLILYLYLFEGP